MTVKAATSASQVSTTTNGKGKDPLTMHPLSNAEHKALDRIALLNPAAIMKLDKNTEAVVINGRVFVGQWQKHDGERHLYWARAVGDVSPTTADFDVLDDMPASKMIDLDNKTVGAVVNGKILIGKWQISEGERHLYWKQAGRLEK